jgi:hypothetical protein
MNGVSIQLVDGLGPLELSSFRRDGCRTCWTKRHSPVFRSLRSIISVGAPRHDDEGLLILLERETGIEPATFSLGS